MKAWILVVVALLCLSNVHAEEFLTARRAVIDTKLSSSMVLKNVRGDVAADVAFFPKLLETQGVEAPRVESNTEVKPYQANQHHLELVWPSPSVSSINYDVAYRVGTFSVRPDLIPEPYPYVLDEDYGPFLESTKFITSEDPEIQELAKEITANITDAVSASYALASWVRNNIEYNLSTLTADVSQTASWTLDQGVGVCDELTVLFLAMSRAAGIPSRYVAGIAHTESTDFEAPWIPHAWAEVYLPDIGWTPFDVTYGQFGWVDAGHIVTKTSGYVDDPSITYSWESGDIELGPMELGGNIVSITPINITPFGLNVYPLVQQVYPGGLLPLRVTVRNPTEFRLPTTLRVEQAPGLYGDPNIPLLMEPNSVEDVFVYVAIPDQIETAYDYSSPVVIKDSYGARATTSVDFGTGYWQLTQVQAEGMVDRYNKGKAESTSRSVDVHCSLSRPFYHKGDPGAIGCSVRSISPKPVKICWDGSCEEITATNKGGFATFPFYAEKSMEAKIATIADDGVVIYYDYITVAEKGTLEIENVECPSSIGPQEEGLIKYTLTSPEEVYDVFVLVEGTSPEQVEDFVGKQQVVTKIKGIDFIDKEGYAIIYVAYSDKLGVRYEAYSTCDLIVADIDLVKFLHSLWDKFLNMFK